MASLEEERARLETETKELERSISRSIHAQGSSASVHRQVSAVPATLCRGILNRLDRGTLNG